MFNTGARVKFKSGHTRMLGKIVDDVLDLADGDHAVARDEVGTANGIFTLTGFRVSTYAAVKVDFGKGRVGWVLQDSIEVVPEVK